MTTNDIFEFIDGLPESSTPSLDNPLIGISNLSSDRFYAPIYKALEMGILINNGTPFMHFFYFTPSGWIQYRKWIARRTKAN